MDQEKPFKTIEVVDSRTRQTCKVACMSCIRGHRTTSCGMPVCRNKIFWTVKRPGRPSNSCNCRYGATGGCKCVVAKSACPHKSKKGEKRSEECRCDEQGRDCCLIEPEQWNVLMALQKPTIAFYPTREALETRFTVPPPISMPTTPCLPNSPQAFSSVSSTPAPPNTVQPMQPISSPFAVYQSPSSSFLAPRFGMMGIGAPQGSEGIIAPDLLSWDGTAPQAPREYRPLQYDHVQKTGRSCCHGPAIPSQNAVSPQQYPPTSMQPQQPQQTFASFDSLLPNISMPVAQPPIQTTFDFEKLSNDYFNYQFPSAICQTCGLNGCTCRNCPPVMQNFSTGSWAQCCGRKHARTAAYVPPTVQHAFQTPPQQQPPPPTTAQEQLPPPLYPAFQMPTSNGQTHTHPHVFQQQDLFLRDDGSSHFGTLPLQQQPPDPKSPHSIPDFTPFDPGEAFTIPEGNGDMDLSDFLTSEIDRPSEGGCCCGDP